MNLRNWVAGSILLACCVVAGCKRDDGKGPGANKVTIGANLPLSGPVAYYGQSPRDGITLALEEVNAAGGVGGQPLEVVYEDTRGSAKDAVSGMRKLVDVNQVPAVIGAGSSSETLAIVKIAQESQTVLLSPVSSSADLTGTGPFFFRTVPSDGAQAKMLAKWLVSDGKKRIGVLFVNSGWGTSLKNHFVTEFKALGGEVLGVEGSEVDDKDFRTQLLNLTRPAPDAIVALIYAREGGRAVKQAREQGISSPIFGADPWTIKDFLEIAGPAAEAVRYTTPGKYAGPEYAAFRDKYVARFGKEPDVYAGHGYDCLKLLARAMNEGARTGPQIRDALAKVKDFRGVTGTTTFDGNGDVVSKEFIRVVIKDGKPVAVND